MLNEIKEYYQYVEDNTYTRFTVNKGVDPKLSSINRILSIVARGYFNSGEMTADETMTFLSDYLSPVEDPTNVIAGHYYKAIEHESNNKNDKTSFLRNLSDILGQKCYHISSFSEGIKELIKNNYCPTVDAVINANIQGPLKQYYLVFKNAESISDLNLYRIKFKDSEKKLEQLVENAGTQLAISLDKTLKIVASILLLNRWNTCEEGKKYKIETAALKCWKTSKGIIDLKAKDSKTPGFLDTICYKSSDGKEHAFSYREGFVYGFELFIDDMQAEVVDQERLDEIRKSKPNVLYFSDDGAGSLLKAKVQY